MWSFRKGFGSVGCFLFLLSLGGATDPSRCLMCSSSETGCEEGQTKFAGNCSQENDDCFTRVTNGELIRGCVSQLPSADERQLCADREDVACVRCTGNECNRHAWLKCPQCDDGGLLLELSCANESQQQARFCPQYRSTDRCCEMARVIDDKQPEQRLRSCLSTLELAGQPCNASEHCVVSSACDEAEILVKVASLEDTSPTRCLVCTSDDPADGERCLQGTLEPQECSLPTDKCFSRLKDDVLQRNCLSTLQAEEQEACSDSSPAACVTCSDASGCNTDRLLRCLKCTTSLDINCPDPSMSGTLTGTFCPRFQSGAACFSRFLNDEVERGCTSALDQPDSVCEGNKKCLTCTADSCNVIVESDLVNVPTCVRCGSQNGDNAACEAGSIVPVECDQLIDQCFTRILDGIVERNCLSTLSEEDQQICLSDDDTSCVACDGHHCNDYTWLRCFRCSKLQDERCAAPATSDLSATLCGGFQMRGLCYAKIVDADVQRGCSIDLDDPLDVCGDNYMCSACSADGCNDVDEDTLRSYTKCIACSTETDEACGQPDSMATTEACDDMCFTRANDDGHLERGCLSSLDDDDQLKCKDATDSTCVTCNDPSCNSASWLKCAKCKSSDNPSCADLEGSALQDLSSFCARTDPQGTCYSRVVLDVLERGCSFDLQDHESVCQGTAGCVTCAEDNCNTHTKEYLLGGMKCVQCTSSAEGPACSPVLPSPEACAERDDHCYSRVADGILTRNCLSTLEETIRETCSDSDDLSCVVCQESGCNRDSWRKCHQCDSSTDATCVDEQQEAQSTYCKSYDQDDECYTKIVDGQLQRGCLSDVGAGQDVCSSAVVCVRCQEDACNSVPEIALAPIKCQQCQSSDDPGCALGTVESTSCPLANDLCYTSVNNEMTLVRGCLSTLADDAREVCQNEANLSCVTCEESGCNVLPWPKCYRCQGSTDENCDRSLTDDQLHFCGLYTATSNCYASIDDNVLSRDCVSPDASNVCENNNRCVACSSSGCNSITKEALDDVHTCFRCSSLDGNCDPLPEGDNECPHRDDQCYTKLLDGVLTRGCLSELDADECQDDANCLVCAGKSCNGMAWESKCYQCNNATSVECLDAQADVEQLHFCQHDDEKRCYVRIDGNSFTRGCASDLDDGQCTDDANCVICHGRGCNSLSYKALFNPASCQRCHSDLHDGCMDGTVESFRCENPDDVCFYRRVSAHAVHRGCLSELSPSIQAKCLSSIARSCHTCDRNGCNDEKWRACFQCSSFTDWSCGYAQNDTTYLKLCETVDDGCFEDRTDEEVRRGCGSWYCANKNTCVECSTDGCNSHSASWLMPTHCLVCDSSDPFCGNGTSLEQYCDYLDEPCYSMVEGGTLYRGCFSRLSQSQKPKCLDSNDLSCVACNGNSCNRDPWRLCIQCRSLELGHYCSREKSPLKSHYCKRYKLNDRCFAKEVDGIVTRGCESDYDTPEEVCEDLDKKHCFLCQDDNCNDRSLNGVQRLTQQALASYVAITVICYVLG